MKASAFKELLTSVRQAGEIRRGARKPSRVTDFSPAEVKSRRAAAKLAPSQGGGEQRVSPQENHRAGP